MRKWTIASYTFLILSIGAIALDSLKSGYMEFAAVDDFKRLIPNTVPPQFAKLLEGNTDDCLTKPSQTKPVTLTQIRTLRQLTDKKQAETLLGNAFCETSKGFKYFTEAGKELTVSFDKVLDYDFSTDTKSNTLTNRNRAADPTLHGRLQTSALAKQRESLSAR